MRYEQKAELQDSNKAKMYEKKKKQLIYQYVRIGDRNDKAIFYSTSRKGFDQEQKDDIKNGFSIAEDTITEIKFNNLDELCKQLQNKTGEAIDE
tara:strand:- start:397 stop:678 length:282 start_codon:yes stop_codon:yes gene_type:complete